MIYAYCRASTDKQDESPETQKGLTLKWAYYNLNAEPDAYYVDVDTSGCTPLRLRPAGGTMSSRLRRGDVVVVAKMDRAFRSLGDFCVTVDAWERMGVRLCLCDYNLDTTTAVGRMLAGMLANFAEFERNLISQRTKEGLAARKAAGRAHTCHAGYGFKWLKVFDKDLQKYVKIKISDPEERKVMRMIVRMRLQEPPVSWDQIRQKFQYELRLKTKTGGEWYMNRIHRAYKVELKLQYQETHG